MFNFTKNVKFYILLISKLPSLLVIKRVWILYFLN